jgi:hypothetical protein
MACRLSAGVIQERRERREAEGAADAGEELAARLPDCVFEDGVHVCPF